VTGSGEGTRPATAVRVLPRSGRRVDGGCRRRLSSATAGGAEMLFVSRASSSRQHNGAQKALADWLAAPVCRVTRRTPDRATSSRRRARAACRFRVARTRRPPPVRPMYASTSPAKCPGDLHARRRQDGVGERDRQDPPHRGAATRHQVQRVRPDRVGGDAVGRLGHAYPRKASRIGQARQRSDEQRAVGQVRCDTHASPTGRIRWSAWAGHRDRWAVVELGSCCAAAEVPFEPGFRPATGQLVVDGGQRAGPVRLGQRL
jgi:hypothetical protein